MDRWNYFNYFTEIEEYFWKKRGSHLLVSPLDWAIMEAWHLAGVPLEAAFKGIDRAFESYARSRRGAGKPLKSLAYCTDAVLDAAAEAQEAAAGKASSSASKNAVEPFPLSSLCGKNPCAASKPAPSSSTLPRHSTPKTSSAASLSSTTASTPVCYCTPVTTYCYVCAARWTAPFPPTVAK